MTMLFEDQEIDAVELYRDWFKRYPGIANPTDINRVEKYDYIVEIGYLATKAMISARKRGAEFVKESYFQR